MKNSFQAMPDARTIDNVLNLSNYSNNSEIKFIIEFNEDGSPIHCHNVN